jgi:ribulose kinase
MQIPFLLPYANLDTVGCIFGLTLQTKHEDIYRAYLEATAFGTKMIMQQYQDWHMEVEKVPNAVASKYAL